MSKAGKAILAVLGAVVVAVHELIDQGPWTAAKVLLVALAFFGAVTVYVVPNLPAGNGVGTWAKAFVGLAVAGTEAAILLLDDNAVSGSEWLVIAMAVLTAAGVPRLPGPASAPSTGGAYRITSLPED